jgi:hypothetical protein
MFHPRRKISFAQGCVRLFDRPVGGQSFSEPGSGWPIGPFLQRFGLICGAAGARFRVEDRSRAWQWHRRSSDRGQGRADQRAAESNPCEPEGVMHDPDRDQGLSKSFSSYSRVSASFGLNSSGAMARRRSSTWDRRGVGLSGSGAAARNRGRSSIRGRCPAV